jgi:ABC-type glutathione transport system ATPase component
MPDTTTPYTHPLVEVNDLHVRFVTREATVHAVNGVSFSARGAKSCAFSASPARARR